LQLGCLIANQFAKYLIAKKTLLRETVAGFFVIGLHIDTLRTAIPSLSVIPAQAGILNSKKEITFAAFSHFPFRPPSRRRVGCL